MISRTDLVFYVVITCVAAFALSGIFWTYVHEGEAARFLEENQLVQMLEMESAEFKATFYSIGPPYNSIARNGEPVVSKGFITIGRVEIFTVAADPRVLPMGSIIFIKGIGVGLVHDTGSAIKGNKLDICLRTMSEAMRFGRQIVEVFVLYVPGGEL